MLNRHNGFIALGGRGARGMLLDFTTGALPAGVTYTGNGGLGTRVNSSGVLVQSVADVARFDYNPVTLASRGILIEPASTNLLTRSSEFDNAAWTKGNGAVTANAVSGPDGVSSGDRFQENGSNALHSVSRAVAVSAATAYNYSVFAKAGERSQICFQYFDGTVNKYPIFSLIDGSKVVDNGIGSAWGVEQYANGWWRFYLAITSGGAASSTTLSIYSALAGAFSYLGDNASGLNFFGAQFSTGLTLPSYVPASGSTVTRTADALAFTIPAGVSTLRYTFDNGTTQDVSVSPGAYVVPTNLNRAWIASIRGF